MKLVIEIRLIRGPKRMSAKEAEEIKQRFMANVSKGASIIVEPTDTVLAMDLPDFNAGRINEYIQSRRI